MSYLQSTKDFMLTYKITDHLEVTGYSDFDFASCLDDRKSISGFIFMMAGGAEKCRANTHSYLDY